MAVNIVNVGFKGTYPSSTKDVTNFITDTEPNDIFYTLGTNYNTQAWVNPNPSQIAVTTNVASGRPLTNLTNRNFASLQSTSVGRNSGSGLFEVTYQFLTCKVQPTYVTCRIYFFASGESINNITVQGSNDNVVWDIIDGPNSFSHPFVAPTVILNTSANKYYEYIKISGTMSESQISVGYIEHNIWGKIFRTDGGEASSITPVTTVEALPKFVPETTGVQDGDLLYYNNGIVTNQRNTYYETERLVLTGNLALSNNHFPNFYILDPNGATRTVTLPPTPLDNQFFRIKTLDPNFAITIDDGGTIATLDTSTLVVDLYWDGTEWTSLSYG